MGINAHDYITGRHCLFIGWHLRHPLQVICRENKQNALGQLLQEIIAKSGDFTCLDWVGKPSQFNSCLPASIASYGAPSSMPPSPPSEDDMQTSVSLLRNAVDGESASRLYQRFESLNAPRFAAYNFKFMDYKVNK
jgi:hypothetical protein